MIELATRIFMDAGLTRKRALLIVAAGGFLLGIPSAVHVTFFENQDWTWGVGLMVSGFFVAFAAIKFGPAKFRSELVNTEGNDLNVGRWFDFLIKYMIPIEFLVLIGWWFYQSVTRFDVAGWWNPFHTYSLGTCVFQWGLAIGVFLIFNQWIYKKTVVNGR
jgi:NSS family neurotransmitter:Na+ symporter